MKRIVFAIFSLAALLTAHAQSSADDQYVILYSLMQQADSLSDAHKPQQALAEYLQVQGDLKKFQKIYPDWNPKIVSFRLNYLAEQIAEVTAQIPATNSAAMGNVAAHAPSDAATTNSAVATLAAELNSLRGQIQSLQNNNTTLEAKLKEALAAQPAIIDSRELANAQEQIRSLMKENDLLKVSLSQNRGPMVIRVDTNALAQAQAALTESNQRLSAQMERVNQLTLENRTLQTRVQSLLKSPEAMEALRQENELLKKQLADLRTAPATTNAPDISKLNSDLAEARIKITDLQSQVERNTLEKLALENRVQQLQSAHVSGAAATNQAENEARISELTQERDDLLAKLGAANRQIYGGKKQDTAARISELADEVKTLRARIAVDEAQAIPYTPEELALFKSSTPQLANRDAGKKPVSELPRGAAQLVAEAQKHFAAKQYDQAEDDYLKILGRDQNNGLALANLATIELEEGKLGDAEKHITSALAQSPDDAYNISILGYLKFRQEKYDEALDALSRAAKLDPQNPEIENYLGVTLAQKGLRAQAETALRKAIQLDPNYAAAHNNLAVIYINQNPPLAELARWHYQKALDGGQPRNAGLEKMLAEKGAPVSAP